MRYAAKVDDNQGGVVRVLRGSGCGVLLLSSLGKGCPDLLVYSPFVRRYFLVEVKDGGKPPSKRKLTPLQRKWHREWPDEVWIVKSEEEALRLVGAL